MSELASQPVSIQSVYAMYREDKLFVNRRYQRKLVWTLEEKQRLIESIVKRYPIPAILIAERKSGDGYEIIDGLQRLHAIVSFIETGFSTLDSRFFDVKHFPTAKANADVGLFSIAETENWISQKEVSAVLDYNLALSVMRNATDDEVNDVFGRINTYGHRLSDQERRQAGVENEFSKMVRTIACGVRGDASADVLPLKSMPSISIDLPMAKHNYEVKADEVVWVEQGVLRSTDLRDSMDEQCIADIAACIVGGQLIERSKDALDAIYDSTTAESDRVNNALGVYGAEKFAEEFKFCLDQILAVCNADGPAKLRNVVFPKGTTNAFPAVFAIILIAFHELIVKDGMKMTDQSAVKKALTGLSNRIEVGRAATSPAERRKNIDTVKGLAVGGFVKGSVHKQIYGNHATVDIDSAIRRSEIELSDYELKQGMLTLANDRKVDNALIEKVLKTLCAIANNGPQRDGKVLIGVTDKDADAARVRQLDAIEPRKVGKRYVVGVVREAKVLGISVEDYYTKWKDAVKHSPLSVALRDSILSHIDFNSYFGLGVIVFTVPPQKELSYYGDDIYWRNGDSTEQAATAKQIAGLAQRF
ncbi:DUF262 domain-containing protein [Cupriavidus sp. L7L]|uniref:GmrSD restriction endonuclease domain-containing protein n=1 Tax=Cupriavidus sp. L7L TaxID=2546443 RepID=UPI001055C720|nr:DUF262 domain-containing protein [Cupriavidus sp. L7L]TDF62225.1 DUF262 domain-containing protein [Cupriavidus sp. L7L]